MKERSGAGVSGRGGFSRPRGQTPPVDGAIERLRTGAMPPHHHRPLIPRGGRGAATIVVTILAMAMAVAGQAHAQQSRNLDLPRLEPSSPGDVFFAVPSPDTIGAATLRAGALLDYARNPLVIGD